jgi:hypothetical protein
MIVTIPSSRCTKWQGLMKFEIAGVDAEKEGIFFEFGNE